MKALLFIAIFIMLSGCDVNRIHPKSRTESVVVKGIIKDTIHMKVKEIYQWEYDNLTPDPNTIYIIVDEPLEPHLSV